MNGVLQAAILAALLGATACRSNPPADVTPVTGSQDELQSGDLVRLKIWREPDLSGDFIVDESGKVVLPKLGPVEVSGLAPDSVKHWVHASFSEYLRNPSIEVVVLRRINVLGAVRAPGLYPVDPTMTVADVLALAGGTSPDAKGDRVRLLRQGQTVLVRVSQSARLTDTPLRSGDQLYVPQRSWVSRNLGFVIGTLTAVTGLVLRIAT
jgi:polysaccharide biosynthesis/export protein